MANDPDASAADPAAADEKAVEPPPEASPVEAPAAQEPEPAAEPQSEDEPLRHVTVTIEDGVALVGEHAGLIVAVERDGKPIEFSAESIAEGASRVKVKGSGDVVLAILDI